MTTLSQFFLKAQTWTVLGVTRSSLVALALTQRAAMLRPVTRAVTSLLAAPARHVTLEPASPQAPLAINCMERVRVKQNDAYREREGDRVT